VLYFSNNFRKFQLDEGLAARYGVEDISTSTVDPDFARNEAAALGANTLVPIGEPEEGAQTFHAFVCQDP
jgi:hypothetical protein